MRIAIVGSRDYPRLDLVSDLVRGFEHGTVVVSGGARGVDRHAAAEARRRELRVDVYEADWTKHGHCAGYLRNQTIVDNSDAVIAFWDQVSKGTRDTITKARRAGLPCRVIGPTGEIVMDTGLGARTVVDLFTDETHTEYFPEGAPA